MTYNVFDMKLNLAQSQQYLSTSVTSYRPCNYPNNVGSRESWCIDLPNNADIVLSPAHNLQVITIFTMLHGCLVYVGETLTDLRMSCELHKKCVWRPLIKQLGSSITKQLRQSWTTSMLLVLINFMSDRFELRSIDCNKTSSSVICLGSVSLISLITGPQKSRRDPWWSSCVVCILCRVDTTSNTNCHSGCSCPVEWFEPVCGADGLTYFSPCYAGCRATSSHTVSTFFFFSFPAHKRSQDFCCGAVHSGPKPVDLFLVIIQKLCKIPPRVPKLNKILVLWVHSSPRGGGTLTTCPPPKSKPLKIVISRCGVAPPGYACVPASRAMMLPS